MIELFLQFVQENEAFTRLIFFSLLMLAGLNFPISEDVLLILAGFLAAAGPQDEILPFYIVMYFGCWISAWEAYALGRYLGPKVYEYRFLKHVITEARVKKFNHYLERFGFMTFIVGRFIPGGVRNVIFMGAGLGKMPFFTFIMRDGLGCLLSSSTLFYIGTRLYETSDELERLFKVYKVASLTVLSLLILIPFFIYFLPKIWRSIKESGKL
jgi:membrane protein DedA with SNARE-associated domain